MTTKQSKEYFFHQRCAKTSTKTPQWLFDVDWQLTPYDYLILNFHWLISAGKNLFYPAKLSILTHKRRNNARQSDNSLSFRISRTPRTKHRGITTQLDSTKVQICHHFERKSLFRLEKQCRPTNPQRIRS